MKTEPEVLFKPMYWERTCGTCSTVTKFTTDHLVAGDAPFFRCPVCSAPVPVRRERPLRTEVPSHPTKRADPTIIITAFVVCIFVILGATLVIVSNLKH